MLLSLIEKSVQGRVNPDEKALENNEVQYNQCILGL